MAERVIERDDALARIAAILRLPIASFAGGQRPQQLRDLEHCMMLLQEIGSAEGLQMAHESLSAIVRGERVRAKRQGRPQREQMAGSERGTPPPVGPT